MCWRSECVSKKDTEINTLININGECETRIINHLNINCIDCDAPFLYICLAVCKNILKLKFTIFLGFWECYDGTEQQLQPLREVRPAQLPGERGDPGVRRGHVFSVLYLFTSLSMVMLVSSGRLSTVTTLYQGFN